MSRYTYADFYVATNGNDSWSGKLAVPNEELTDGPFLTLEKARRAVRIFKKGVYRDIYVLIRGGEYSINRTINFVPNDSHYPGFRIVYAAYQDETPIFSSDAKIEGWTLATDVAGLPEKAVGKVYEAAIPKMGKERFYCLFENGKMLTRARSRSYLPTVKVNCKDGWGNIHEVVEADRSTIHYAEGSIKNWDNLSDIELFIQPNVGFVTNYLSLESVDEANSIATTAIPATYGMGIVHKGAQTFDDGSYRVENCIEDLDAPGKWVINTNVKKVYYYPINEVPENVTYPSLTELVFVDGHELGGIVTGLVFEGITFTRGDRAVMLENDITLQHEWEFFNKSNALVRFRNTKECVVDGCRFCNTGSSAIRFDLYAQCNIVKNNLIDYVGGSGILFAGYGPGVKDVNRCNRIENNHIHHNGQSYYQAPAIMLWQSGDNFVKNNLMHHITYDAIVLSGVRPSFYHAKGFLREMTETIRVNEVVQDSLYAEARTPKEVGEYWGKTLGYAFTKNNIIEDNEMFLVMLKLFDGNAIYLSDVGRNNVINRNYIHHLNGVGMQQAIRTDAYVTDTPITNNIVYNCTGGGINTKHYNNHVINNIIADIRDIVYLNDAGKENRMFIGYISLWGIYETEAPPNVDVQIDHNIMYKTYAHNPFYRESKNNVTGMMEEVNVGEAVIDYNVYYDVEASDKGAAALEKYQNLGVDEHSIIADPKFRDIATGDFELCPDSPALKLGFKNIDMSVIGLTDEFSKKYDMLVREQLGNDYDDFGVLEKLCVDKNKKTVEQESDFNTVFGTDF
ncbi:right-handed parallel beta-helix repeat-containing protein [Candidatus Epulonipiscium viviparus]|uniref:right-handed parallel beta-helix repeat-containing protein n=1 Tax=Candidatus Epulonipiscium viviparus TaxID=420336 RepID=UPI00273804DC|nr:right-handed parallel beta-helix repeat-containing protein [Candidatus Epulopiscium viviparus]